MLFNSMDFLIFFPVVTLGYFLLPQKARWVFLLAASYFFYMCWNPVYALLLLLSTAMTYLCGLLLGRAGGIADAFRRRRLRVAAVALCFGINLAILFFFKYFNFFFYSLAVIGRQVGVTLRPLRFDVLLPVGISFFTFQALGYTVDVYRGDIEPVRHFGKYALFVSFFPQLVAGPIERSANLLGQFDEVHRFDFDRMRQGLLLMLWGLVQKVVIADRAAVVVNAVFAEPGAFNGMQILFGIFCFSVQLFCDFSGYSDIAIGAAQVMGFRLMDNFHQPYFATSIQDFWRRWHISLSTWFRDYVYIPLGGNRGGRLRKYRNLMITFLVSGLWHGANWTYVLWGGLHGLLQVLGDALGPAKQWCYRRFHIRTDTMVFRAGQRALTFTMVCFLFALFRAESLSAAAALFRQLFTSFHPGNLFDGQFLPVALNVPHTALLLGCIALLFFVNWLQMRGSVRDRVLRQNLPARWAFYYAALFFVIIFGYYGPGYDASQFIYFQF